MDIVDTFFSPSFGNRPSQLVGRDATIRHIIDGLASQPGSKERATLILGQRGSGKTVLLWELADQARKQGFVVATPTVVSESMLNRVIEKIQDDGDRYIKSGRGKLTGGSLGALGFSVGLQFESSIQETKSFGYKMLKLGQRLGEQGHGILILVDEVQAQSVELKELISTYLELVGEQQNVAIVLAGLPGAISSVLNNRVLTFLNRARKITLEPLAMGDVDAFYAHAFKQLGIQINSDLRRKASSATEGSPYLLQLLGHNIVQYADEHGNVNEAALDEAIESSRIAFEEEVCATTIAALSEKDVDFLRAMSHDNDESSLADIAERMGVTADYAQKYRKRLIDSGVICASKRGHVAFAVPYVADYLRNQE
ncbi:MAG: ATP-binding protein [Eggerthellaceae bacterium]|nr:ATP-binding protein [Eggerthellaceae bacterium]